MIWAGDEEAWEIDMPDVLVELGAGGSQATGSKFLDAIHRAIVETLHTPEDGKVLRLVEHPAERFAIPGSAGERYTHIEITMFAGRTGDQALSLPDDRQESRTLRRVAKGCEDHPD